MSILTSLGRDLRLAVRSLLRDRRSVALAVVALSLGIGASTVIFSVVYSVLVNAMPFADQSRVVHFYITAADWPGQSAWYPAPEFDDYRAQNQVFTQVLGGASLEVLYTLDNATYRVRGALIDPKALPTLGLQPVLGRAVIDADGAPGAPPTFLMSDRLWHERFNRDPNVIGMTLKLNGVMRTLIAITPPRFLLHGADVFFPTTITATSTRALLGGSPTDPLSVWTYGRLKPGVSLAQAAANLDVIAHNEARRYPTHYPAKFGVTVMSLADAYTADSLKEMVYILVGAVLMLLMIACSNVANLLLARATAREAELALRASLGASRARLMQQLLAESFVLAASGTVLGGLFAYLGLQWVRTAIPVDALPSEMEIRFSGQALLATVGVTLLTTVICGLAPALRAARGDLQGRLTGTGKGVSVGAGHGWLRTLLVVVQMTLAIVLLVGAGLMMRTLLTLQRVDTGVDPNEVLVGRFEYPQNQQRTPADAVLFLQQVTQRISALPNVVAVSPAMSFPLESGFSSPVIIQGTAPVAGAGWSAALECVGDGYVRALGIPLLSGHFLSATEVADARKVAVVNRMFTHQFLADANPIGRMVSFAALNRGADPKNPPQFEIVGMVGDTRNGGLEDDVRPEAYVPYTASSLPPSAIIVRSNGNPLGLQSAMRQQIWAVDEDVALMGTMSLEEMLNRDALASPRFGTGLLGTFAGIGLILAAIGVFSVMAYTVSLQTRDIGIRMALGAEPRGVMRMMLLRGLRPIAIGVVIGLAASYALSRLLADQIYGVSATDPWTFAGVAVILALVGTVACLIPARRATRVDPLIALRSE